VSSGPTGVGGAVPPPLGVTSAPVGTNRATPDRGAFATELTEALGEKGDVRFSDHATRRLASRSIRLTDGDLERLAQATDQAAAKGANDSLILMDGLGLIVNVPNRTVVTALDTNRLDQGIVTDIDSTIFVPK